MARGWWGDWAGTADWCVSLVTGAGRSCFGRSGQQDLGRSGNVGAEIGPAMRVRVRGFSRQAERLPGNGSGGSCSSLRPPSFRRAAPT